VLYKYLNDFEGINIHIVDNGNQGIKDDFSNHSNIHIYEPKNNIGVAASWNFLCNKIFEQKKYALILNDDIYCGYGTDVVIRAIENSKIGITQSFHNFSVLLLSKVLYENIGSFDEIFYPAYYEDSDYIYRVKLKGLLHEIDASLNPEIAHRSMTQEKDPALVNQAMQNNRIRYIDKWGGSPLLEKYITPYNMVGLTMP
jgi:GT2 family glycosyltransferase